jgi:hypothetical protein
MRTQYKELPPQVGLFWSGVRGLPPALPLVEDVSLLILTPLFVLVRTEFRVRSLYQILFFAVIFLQ